MQSSDGIQTALLYFKRNVFLPRSEKALMYTILLQFVLTTVLVLPLHISSNPLSPSVWTSNSLRSTFSSAGLFRHVLFIAGTCILAVFHVKYFTVSPIIIDKRIKRLPNVFDISKLLFYLTAASIGGVFTWCFLGMQDDEYNGLTVMCMRKSSDTGENFRDRYCLNEKHLFLVLHGFFSSILWAISYFHGHDRYLKFPLFSQSFSAAIRPELVSLLRESFHHVIGCMPWYYIGYYLRGHNLQKAFLKLANAQHVNSPLDNLLSLSDLKLGFTLVWVTTLVIFNFKLWCSTFQAVHCKSYKFLVEKDVYNEKSIAINEGLAAWDFHLLQYLGYLDLRNLSERSQDRRREVFSLSTPGGHPHNWNKVTDECLGLISSFTTHLTSLIYHPSVNTSVNCPPPEPPIAIPPTPLSPSDHEAMLSWLRSRLSLHNLILLPLMEKMKLLYTKTMDLPFVKYVFGEIPGSNYAKLFADTQPVIWSVEALGNLIVYSYTEDTFGVVQTRIGDILSKFLSLHNILEQLYKTPGFLSRNKLARPLPRDRQLLEALKLTVKSSIYKIVVTFGGHLKSIPIPPSQKNLLIPFLDFKES